MVEMDLSGQTAIVTGAGRGIGKVISHRLAQAGANVVAAARTESEIEETVAEVEELGVEGLAVPTDLQEVDDIDNLVDEAVAEFGVPEILVNNAAQNLAGPLLEQTVEEVDRMLDTNLRGLFLLSQRWGQEFVESDTESGSIVNISSATSHIGVARMTLYSGTNGGVRSVTRGLASEFGPEVRVNTVTPGLIGIERIRNLLEDQGDEIYELDRIPMDRLGEPDDIADAVLFFASDLSSYVTGTELIVDGGVNFTAGLYK
jgi:NAD(P)-dependent dehydrogenase (short-subunit alcohol dehydrogenase family)